MAFADYPTMLVCTSGTKYSRCFNAWIEANGFGSAFGIWASCLRLADNLEDIELWRAGLPGVVTATRTIRSRSFGNWRKAIAKGRPARAPRLNIVIGKVGKNGRTISWPQELIRRAADAMRDARTNDLYVLAARGLNAAIRTEADVALLIAPPKASTAAVFANVQTFPVINIAT